MSQTLYLDCSFGISGDMMAAALLDLGADQDVLKKALKRLPVDGFEIHISRVKKNGLDACDFDVVLDDHHQNYDHNMEYLHGDFVQEHEYLHNEHSPSNEHRHEQRGLAEITDIIRKAELTPFAEKTALRIFDILADAESKAHGISKEQVHFHEVGAVDSIVDIVAVAVCLDNLHISQVIVPVLCDGHGTIRCQHGIIPVPVPAVVHVAETHKLPLRITETEGELVTPTGAAIAAAVRTSERLPSEFRILKSGLGAGKRQYTCPGILRAMLIKPETNQGDIIYKLETNIDDSTGEMLGYLMDRLFETGAKDVQYIPVFMKKNRPAYQLNVLCCEEDIHKLEDVIFRETTTIGIRRVRMERTVLEREILTFTSSLGEAAVKICRHGGETYLYPEYDNMMMISQKHKLPLGEVQQIIRQEATDFYKKFTN